MSQIYKNLKVPIGDDIKELLDRMSPGHTSYRILRQSVDARRKSSPHWVYTIEVFENGETAPEGFGELEQVTWSGEKPLIIGAGPAGLFAALRLVERGVPCTLIERGSPAEKRIMAINQHWRYGKFNADDNVCFGEGGAGLYSDGKLITRIKSHHVPYVMDRLIRFGAPEEIRYMANPHVGSDRIRRLIPKMRAYLLERGCEILFNSPVVGLLYEEKQVVGVKIRDGRELRGSAVVLATGHSAQDIFNHLREAEVTMEGKSFALGLRVEHPQEVVNRIQLREYSESQDLGAANYKLTYQDRDSGLGVYSFCMCPGGYVLSSTTEADGVVCNGMSNYRRNSPFANSAIVVTVDHEKLFGENNVFGGLDFRRKIETDAYKMVQAQGGNQQLPIQRVMDFISGRASSNLGPSSSLSGIVRGRLDLLLPPIFVTELVKAFENFQEKMRGFIDPKAQLHGIESRTSCPVRVTRHTDTLESVSHGGLYPCGEGAGYAGGITSAACDGIRIAESIVKKHASQHVTAE